MQRLRAQAIVTVTLDVVNSAERRASDVGFDFSVRRKPRTARRLGRRDSAATTQKPPAVNDALAHFQQLENVNSQVDTAGDTAPSNAGDDAAIWTRNAGEAMNAVSFRWDTGCQRPLPYALRKDPTSLALSTGDIRFSVVAGETMDVTALVAAEINDAAAWSLGIALIEDFDPKSLSGGVLWYRIAAGADEVPFRRVGVLPRNNQAMVLAHSGRAAQAVRIDLRMEIPQEVRAGTYRSCAICSLYT